MLNSRIKAIPIAKNAPTLNEFLERRPKLNRLDVVKVVLLYQEYLIDNYNEIAVDQPELNIWDL